MCVCVCVRERERERERDLFGRVCVCLIERERVFERVCVCVRARKKKGESLSSWYRNTLVRTTALGGVGVERENPGGTKLPSPWW